MNRPALKFYGDSDGDGVMNGFDCAPFNKRKQGPEHEAEIFNQGLWTPKELKEGKPGKEIYPEYIEAIIARHRKRGIRLDKEEESKMEQEIWDTLRKGIDIPEEQEHAREYLNETISSKLKERKKEVEQKWLAQQAAKEYEEEAAEGNSSHPDEYDPDSDIKARGYDSAEQYYKENAPDKDED
jgi:hypothetical protein